jgi:hypothetical protein
VPSPSPVSARTGADTAGSVLGGVFGAVSRLRSAKSLHPKGVVHEAELRVHGRRPSPDLLAGVPFLTHQATYRGIVRFSRSIGLPEAAPDILGMAIRLPDAHGPGRPQDLLLVTSRDHALVHHLILPAHSYIGHPYSSVLTYRGGDGAFVLVARVAPGAPLPDDGAGTEFDELLAAAETGGLRYELGPAPLTGRMRPVATLSIGGRLPGEANAVRFNPWNTGGGLEPAGPVNRMRQSAYRLSQRGWM